MVFGQLDVKLRAKAGDGFFIEFRPIALLKHRKRRLLTTDFFRQDSLREARRPARLPDFEADISFKIDHAYIMDFSPSNRKSELSTLINRLINLSTCVYNIVDNLGTVLT